MPGYLSNKTRSRLDAYSRQRVGAIVVGADGSDQSRNAIEWAAREADRSGRRLLVLTATGRFGVPLPYISYGRMNAFDMGEHMNRIGHGVKDELAASYPGLEVVPVIRRGAASEALLAIGDRADELVVGKRGLGPLTRAILASTSIAVARRARVPVIVVPDVWSPAARTKKSILLGIDPRHHNNASAEFAFQRSRELAVPLHALHVLKAHQMLTPSDADVGRWRSNLLHLVESVLSDCRARYPDVAVSVEQVTGEPALALLEAAADAQLLVLGRREPCGELGGFPFGSVGRAVLHYSETPVAIVGSWDREHRSAGRE
jgi:nucleotide-binding universal stress UspA family protein